MIAISERNKLAKKKGLIYSCKREGKCGEEAHFDIITRRLVVMYQWNELIVTSPSLSRSIT